MVSSSLTPASLLGRLCAGLCAEAMSLITAPRFPGPVLVVWNSWMDLPRMSPECQPSAHDGLDWLTAASLSPSRGSRGSIQSQGKGTRPEGGLSWKWVCCFLTKSLPHFPRGVRMA